ncbi:class II aldolase/adducin family protein [Paraburkholderia elongata]|uniref:Class II aldolase/adducin family protein n=1 Tax=Paraburkholderia elongata TaxID=2675747 RepID=A0A972NV13_9BURK|nr:class II aldolase/adducin family protein [Paraburkholderia elongata]NPT60371.1 class II aldolase/adducin family protein [Paraburkholderia elongata]
MTVDDSIDTAFQREVRVAARALARAGLVHAYGHCSVRIGHDWFLVCTAKPMALIVPNDNGTIVAIDEPLPAGVLGEVRIHQAIYRSRPDVSGIARTTPGDLMTLSAARCTPRRRHGFGAYFPESIPLWDDVRLARTDERARGIAETIGAGNVVVMRGNGAVVAAASLKEAVVLSRYLEDAARVELQLRMAGLATEACVLTEAEATERAVRGGGIIERMWEYMTSGDPESV